VILSDRDLRAEITAGRLVIEPFDPASVQPSSIDLRAGKQFRVFANHRYPHIDVRQPLENLTELVEATEDEPFMLHPGEFVLGTTLESVTLPNDLVARLEGKSSLGRLGLLIHSSLPGSESVPFLRDGCLTQRSIGEIVRKQLEGHVVSFDPRSFAIVYRRVTGWHETPPDRIFEVRLASGRCVRLTGGHAMFTLDRADEIVKARVMDLRVGTRVGIAGTIPDPPVKTASLDLIALAPEEAYREVVCGGPNVARAFERSSLELATALRNAGVARTDHYRDTARLPVAVALQDPVVAETLGARDWVALRRGRHRLPAVLPVDPSLAWLLGLYAAGGSLRGDRLRIATKDAQVLDRAGAVLSGLGLPARRSARAVTCRSRLLARVMEWLRAGTRPNDKRIPVPALGWPQPLLGSFLRGLIDGNGARERQAEGVSLWISSRELAEDLLVVCSRLGAPAKLSVRNRNGHTGWHLSIALREHEPLPRVHVGDRVPAGPGRGDLGWDPVVEVRATGALEPVYDLEVRPADGPTENFLAGRGGVFVSNTAGFVDAGFSGQLTLELSNVANLPISIYPGMLVGQLCVFRMTSPAERPYGSDRAGSKYQGQRGPTPSRYFENFER
jgi:deoxycytidine triphosphate deaminase/intein/homing endonuclease